MWFFGVFLGGGSRTHEKSITSLNMSQPPLLETTEPAHTNASQTDRHLQTHTAKQKLSVQRAVPAPASHEALGNFQVLTHMSSGSTQKLHPIKPGAVPGLLNSSFVLTLLSTSSQA